MRKKEVLRALLRALLADRADSAGLVYLPRGEREMRRMIAALMDIREDGPNARQIDALYARLLQLEQEEASRR